MRVLGEGARVLAFIGVVVVKVGRLDNEIGGASGRVGDEERKGRRSGDEGDAGREE